MHASADSAFADPFAIPERAMRAYERMSGLRVTVHDLAGTLWPYLPPDRFRHTQPLCQAVKLHHGDACMDFDITRLRRELPSQPEGRVQVCHAGLVEFIAPVFERKRLAWVLFAGLRLPGRKLRQAVRDSTPPPRPLPWPKGSALPAPVDDEEAAFLLELLRQLAARLKGWQQEMAWAGVTPPAAQDRKDGHEAFPDPLATRRAEIVRFVYTRHTAPVGLADLAERLKLSASRAAHAVKEVCGRTFVQLLTEARLRTAANLLHHTDLSVLEVSLRSGFGEVSHFHRAFRRRFGLTPLKYRKQAERVP